MRFLDKTKFLLIAVMALAIVSCSEEDEDIQSSSTSIEGNKYETTYAKLTTEYSGQSFEEEYDTKEELTENELYGTMEFKAEGVLFSDGVESGTWAQSGSTVTITEDGESGTATIDGDMLKITASYTMDDTKTTVEMHFTKM